MDNRQEASGISNEEMTENDSSDCPVNDAGDNFRFGASGNTSSVLDDSIEPLNSNRSALKKRKTSG